MPTNYNGYTVPEPTDIADAPAAFEEFSDSIPFNEYVAIESLSADTTVVDSYNGKMIFATADLTLTFGTLTDGFSVAVTADTGVTVDYLGVDKASQQTTAYQVASVVAVNGTNIISISGGACPPCPPAGTPEATVTAITGSGTTHTYGSYIAYEFKTSGTITTTEGTVPEALLVGGGGSGGCGYGGGGGSGGFLQLTNPYLSAMTHNVTVGDGAAGRTTPSGTNVLTGLSGDNGEVSRLHDYYSPGGGAGNGGQYNVALNVVAANAGLAGGSGGGASGSNNGGTTAAGGSGVSGIGFDGGAAAAILGAGPGGGGAGGAGLSNSGSYIAGAGGPGASSSITGSAVTLAGGGGGWGSTTAGAGGSSIGGAGGTNSAPTAGAGDTNTGSGGGGSQGSYLSGDGGSGVVVVKVLATNASSVDTTGWTEVTAAMLAAAEKKRKVERKKLEKKLALEAKSEELSGQTNKTDIKENE